jgi:hypothetical protein
MSTKKGDEPRSQEDVLKEHKLVRELTKERGRLPNTTSILGYVGDSGSPDIVRVYLNLDFDEYVDVRRQDILHATEAGEDMIQFGGTLLWVDKNASCKHVQVTSDEVQAQFLEGEIAGTYLDFETPETYGSEGGFAIPTPYGCRRGGGFAIPTPYGCRRGGGFAIPTPYGCRRGGGFAAAPVGFAYIIGGGRAPTYSRCPLK